MDNEPGNGPANVDQLIQLCTAIIQQYRPPDSTPSNTLEDGNDLTLSIFSELQYALQSRNLSAKGPATQALPAQVDVPHSRLVFKRALPHYAERVVAIYRGNRLPAVLVQIYDQDSRDGGNGADCEQRPTFRLPHADEAIAVQIQDCDERVRLVSFVTYVPIDTSGSDSRVAVYSDSPQAF
ncbi:hypothetical protein F3087_43720 [Nocardia colli]|uniref:Uncharacterized protein n=1 Tax=Nocardia colli TaxID=2545717 RepID=A0A5N0DTN0_9NOCA|nr:hypothetical protein [Nocardia colli]KAA8879670.1 hypothetical protein F3087_43720 [Nocardia colli]